MRIYDPITGEDMTLMKAKGESDECSRAEEESVIKLVMYHFSVDRVEAIRMLSHSDVDDPVVVNDEVYWVE